MAPADEISPPKRKAEGPERTDKAGQAGQAGSGAKAPDKSNPADTSNPPEKANPGDRSTPAPKAAQADKDISARRRAEMVERQLRRRGIRSAPVLAAMGEVPREAFVPPALEAEAYFDQPLPIGEGQTISQPYIVAFMIEALELAGGETVLEVGTGSGYAAAVLSRIAGRVITIERIGAHAARAGERLAALGYGNIEVVEGDGSLGWPAGAPYDAIVVTAGAPEVPAALKAQLKPGGRLVLPVGPSSWHQELKRLTKRGARGGGAEGAEGDEGEPEFKEERLAAVRFVPLVGQQGWQ